MTSYRADGEDDPAAESPVRTQPAQPGETGLGPAADKARAAPRLTAVRDGRCCRRPYATTRFLS